MTDATFAGTLPVIQRTDNHDYIVNGVKYPGPSRVLDAALSKPALVTWAANETAEAALALWESDATVRAVVEATGRDGMKKALTNRANWRRDEAAQLGSAVHAWADDMLNGRPLPPLSDLAQQYAKRYAEWWQASGWKVRLTEAIVFAPPDPGVHTGWGGTFDLLAYDRDGKTVLADIKTGKGIYREVVLQLTAYKMALMVQPAGSLVTYPMPNVDRVVALHVTGDKPVREVPIASGPNEWSAWCSALDIYQWTQTVKGKL